ncbi:MAG: hypothetical protein ACTHNU_04465 [Gaiellales bacterium]
MAATEHASTSAGGAGGEKTPSPLGALWTRLWTWLTSRAVSLVKLVVFIGVPLIVLGLIYRHGRGATNKDDWAMGFSAGVLLSATVVMRLVPAPSQGATAANSAAPAAPRTNLLAGLYVGLDGRWSTSKVQSLLWTYAVAFAVIALYVGSNYGIAPAHGSKDLFSSISFDDTYLLLLGGPYAAMVLAKGITSMKTSDGTISKTTITDSRTPEDGLRDIIANDSGSTDIGDFQFFAFNLIALAIFYSEFLGNFTSGMPKLPTFLVGLTSTSALAYVGKKAVESSQASITSLSARPAIQIVKDTGNLAADVTLTITGQHLQLPAGSPTVSVGTVAVTPTRHSLRKIELELKKDTTLVVDGSEVKVEVPTVTSDVTDTIGVILV